MNYFALKSSKVVSLAVSIFALT